MYTVDTIKQKLLPAAIVKIYKFATCTLQEYLMNYNFPHTPILFGLDLPFKDSVGISKETF